MSGTLSEVEARLQLEDLAGWPDRRPHGVTDQDLMRDARYRLDPKRNDGSRAGWDELDAIGRTLGLGG